MAVILKAEEIPVRQVGEGWKETTIADSQTVGTPAMVARRWSLAPGACGPEVEHGETEEILYVIEGSGAALVGDQRHALGKESMLWLSPGDRFQLEAGEQGLEVLQAYAPGE